MLAATLAELTAVGYAELSVERVAERAGVHKTTVYRRWQDREALVVDALTDDVAREVRMPNTGSLETDLCEHAASIITWLNSSSGSAIIATMVAGGRVPEIAAIKQRFFEDRLRRAEPVVTRAVARGEVPADTDPDRVIKTLIAPIYLRLLITAEPIDATTARDAARLAAAAARGGLLRREADVSTGGPPV